MRMTTAEKMKSALRTAIAYLRKHLENCEAPAFESLTARDATRDVVDPLACAVTLASCLTPEVQRALIMRSACKPDPIRGTDKEYIDDYLDKVGKLLIDGQKPE